MNHVSRTIAGLAAVLLIALAIVVGTNAVNSSTSHAAGGPSASETGQPVTVHRSQLLDGAATVPAVGYVYSAAPIFRPPSPENSASAPVAGDANSATSASSTGSSAVLEWNSKAQRAAIDVAEQPAPKSMIYISFVQAAVYDAVVAIEGDYEPYKLFLARRPGASVDAAVASAAHDVLVHYFPGQHAKLHADYAGALGRIPDGEPKQAGIAVGREAAAGIIAVRQDDGLEADIGFAVPPTAPGSWQPPAGQTSQTPWVSELRPFMIERPDQFRPGPPPALGSAEWATEFNEVKRMGAAKSAERTAEQTDVARFWSTNSVVQYNAAFRQIAQDRKLDAVQTARLFAMGNMVGSDALIGCFDAKYHYLFWRPMFAIPGAENDGNPATVPDAAWQPLLSTPNHPEYPAGHGCLTSAEAEVFASFLGGDKIDLQLASATPGLLHPTRHYASAADLAQEIVNARVWGGLHYRGSGVAGTVLGQAVARWTLSRYFLPDHPRQGDQR